MKKRKIFSSEVQAILVFIVLLVLTYLIRFAPVRVSCLIGIICTVLSVIFGD